MNTRDKIIEAYEPQSTDDSPETRREELSEFFETCPIATKSEAIEWLCTYWPDISRGGHRGNIQRWYSDDPSDDKPLPPWTYVEAGCPQCELEAVGAVEIAVRFGMRKMADGTVRTQSWCRDCRSSS